MGGGYKTNGEGGTLTVTVRVSNDSSRYAMPSPSVSDFVYAALLYKGEESPVTPPPEDFVEGVPSESGDKLVFSFQRPDEADGITLEVFAFKAGTTDFSKDNALLSGKKTALKVNGEKIEVVETIALSVYTSSTEKGTVRLQIKVPDGCTLTIDDITNFTVTGASPNFTIRQNGDSIPAGKYSVTFTVKKIDETNTKEEIVYIFPESINVLPGMHTDTWWNGATSSATKVITQDMASTTVYVRGAGGYYDTSPYNATATADDKNSGSFLAPLATIQKAVDTVIARNDGTSEYTICVDGTLDGTTAEYLGEKGMADFSALAQDLNLTIKALSGTATLDGGAVFNADGTVGTEGIKKRIIYAKPDTNGALNLTIENLVITGGSSGGIAVYNITLKMKGCEISRCTNNGNGSGVYISGGTFTMESGTIFGNTNGGGVYVLGCRFTMKGGTISGNESSGSGGGVHARGGRFEMSGGTISNCTATAYGGGVYISSSGIFKMSGTAKITDCKTTSTDSDTGGGGIYNAGTLTITGGTISDCTSATSGGGIYNNVTNASITSTIENCEISGCKANGTASDNGYGGGIYNASGALELTNVNITGGNNIDNPDANRGGGIYNAGTLTITGGIINDCKATTYGGGGGIYSAGTLTVTNGTISKNTAKYGGAVWVKDGTFTMSGGTIGGENEEDGNIASSHGGGVYVGGSGIFKMEGDTSTISKNKTNYGGGVYVEPHSRFEMGGGIISGNEASSGGGVYINVMDSVAGTFIMSGSASVPAGEDGKNNVYLYGNVSNFATITVAGELSDSTPVPVATITPSVYKKNRPLLSAGIGVTLDGTICKKFAVTPQSDGTEWRVALDGTDGVLIKKYEMGETGPGGGTVFYYSADGFTVNGKTCHYLEVSKESLGDMTWCPCTSTSGYCAVTHSNDIGAGYANTQTILDHPNHASATASNCAARACAEYSTSTTSAGEWFLPSLEEANKIYRGGTITSSEPLWYSASNYSNATSIAGYITVSPGGCGTGGQTKTTVLSVRAVRAF